MRGRSLVPARVDAARRLEPVHLGHLHVHQHDVVGLALTTRPPRCRWSEVGAVAHLLQQAQRELLVHDVVLGEQDAQRMARREAGVELRLGGRSGRARRASCAEQPCQRVERCDWRSGLARYAAKRPVVVARFAPSERAEQHAAAARAGARGCARASVMPSISGMCMSRIATSKRSPASSQRQRLAAATAVARDCHAPLGGLQREHAPVGGVVVDDQQALAGSSGCTPAKSRGARRRQLGGGRAMREAEGRAVARALAFAPTCGRPSARRAAC